MPMAEKPAPATSMFTLGLVTLKRRDQFLRIRRGARWATAAFVLEAKRRIDEAANDGDRPRFGFTVAKQVGKAVERNRIRRRLKAAVRDVQMAHARRDFDYVLIARRPALSSTYGALVNDLVTALERVHRGTVDRPKKQQRDKTR
jgi:ribonuclease P protein component